MKSFSRGRWTRACYWIFSRRPHRVLACSPRRIAAGLGLLLLLAMQMAGQPFHVAISRGSDRVTVSVPEAVPNETYLIEYSEDLTNWTSCFSVAADSNSFAVGFLLDSPLSISQQFFRARRL